MPQDSSSAAPSKRKNLLLVLFALALSTSGLLFYAYISADERHYMGGSKSAPAMRPYDEAQVDKKYMEKRIQGESAKHGAFAAPEGTATPPSPTIPPEALTK